jgi:moderate conductance mechanosensitive channel
MTIPQWIKRGRGDRRRFVIQVMIGAILFIAASGLNLNLVGANPAGATVAIATSLPTDLQNFNLNPPEFDSLLNSDTASVQRATVRLDGNRLFTISAPANGSITAEQRVATIEERLQEIVDEEFDPDTLEVTVRRVRGLPVIYAAYEGLDEPVEVMTVTSLDAEINTTAIGRLAQEFRQDIRSALLRAKEERQPEFLRQQGLITGAIIATIGIGSLLITSFQRRLQAERRSLETQFRTDTDRLSNSTTESAEAVMTALLQQQMATRQRLSVNDIQRRLAQVAQLGLWFGGGFFILGLFPYTRIFQPIIITLLRYPIRVLAVCLATYLFVRFSAVFIDRLFWVLQNSTSFSAENSQRLALRFSTFSRVVKASSAVILVTSGIITALAVIGIEVGPLLAGAGIVGLAISFASQSLVKDIINGFFILFEDQYGVGDVIIVDDVAGLVENLNLRITQLRNEEGQLITIPNSAITIVRNLSKEWSRVDLMVTIAHNANIDEALALIAEVANDMSRDRPWKDLILEPPSLLGVDKLDHAGATVRLWIKTQPLKQWDVAREYRRRLKLAIDAAGIPIGIPQQSLAFTTPLDFYGELKNAAIATNGHPDPGNKTANSQEGSTLIQ